MIAACRKECGVEISGDAGERGVAQQHALINEYNTEMPEKRADYLGLIKALEKRAVPIDGVSHQAHVDVSRPVQWLADSIKAVEKLDPTLLQAISELDVNASKENSGADVSAGTTPPYTRAYASDADAAIEVGYYYRDSRCWASSPPRSTR